MEETSAWKTAFARWLIMQGHLSTPAFMKWFADQSDRLTFEVKTIPFSQLDQWTFDRQTGNIHHQSGKFFSIQGLRVQTNFGPVSAWEQPIIVQPEVGILGIITKVEAGERYFLMQAKMEPGNITITQLSPTVQATKSNYTRVHQGKLPTYLEYFLDPAAHGAKVLVDVLQPEQGGRFFKKQNRNIILELTTDIQLENGYCWLTLPQLKQLLRVDNLLNMDARTVLSCWSETNTDSASIRQWLTQVSAEFKLEADLIPLKELEDWHKSDREISHIPGNYFSVIAIKVEADNREVASWSQPLLKAAGTGLIGFIKNGDSYLVQAKVEPGNRNGADIGPTVSFSNYMQRSKDAQLPPFVTDFLQASKSTIVFDTHLSEEGGRFFHAQNRYMIIEAAPQKIPAHFKWVSLAELRSLVLASLCSVEARSLVATI